jgi:L-lactate utilization protein LutC
MSPIPTEDLNKAKFLQRVREALGRTEPLVHTPDHPALKANQARQTEKVKTVLAKNEARRQVVLDRLTQTATAASWSVNRVKNAEDAASVVAEIASSAGAKNIVRSAEDVFKRINVDAALRGIGVSPTILAAGRSRRRGQLKEIAFRSDLGITGVSYAIAETASCAVIPRKGVARLTSLAPPVLVLIVEEEQVVETLDDFFAITRLTHMQARTHGPNYFNFISGPSRTADIEQTLTIGVHGPGEVHMVLLG